MFVNYFANTDVLSGGSRKGDIHTRARKNIIRRRYGRAVRKRHASINVCSMAAVDD